MKKPSTLFALIAFAIILIFSCKKDKDESTLSTGNGTNNSLRTTVSGMVLDESNAPLTGVTVNAHGQTTTTNQYGIFVLKNINANINRCVIQFSKTNSSVSTANIAGQFKVIRTQ